MDNTQSFIIRSINDLGDRIFGRKYRLLDKIVKELDRSDTCPDILYLGDSSVLRSAIEDTDKRTIGEMLAADIKGKAHLVEISHGAYHLDIFFHILSTLKVTRHCPKLVIIPVNIRSFTPQWYYQPKWQFKEEIDLLTRYHSGHGLKKYYRRKNIQSDYESIRVKYPLSSLSTIGEFEELRLNKNNPDVSSEERRRELFIYFFLCQVQKDNPRLLRIIDVINLARELKIKILFYISAMNINAAIKYVGEEFNYYYSNNIEIVKNLIIKENGSFLSDKDIAAHNFKSDSVVCADYSRSLGNEYFFHSESIDEHLNQKGREYISKRNMEIALQML